MAYKLKFASKRTLGRDYEEMYAATIEQFGARNRPARLDDVRLESLFEGRCVQTLHIGSFDDEAELLSRIHHEFIPAQGIRMVGTHHEIYLSEFGGPQ